MYLAKHLVGLLDYTLVLKMVGRMDAATAAEMVV